MPSKSPLPKARPAIDGRTVFSRLVDLGGIVVMVVVNGMIWVALGALLFPGLSGFAVFFVAATVTYLGFALLCKAG